METEILELLHIVEKMMFLENMICFTALVMILLIKRDNDKGE